VFRNSHLATGSFERFLYKKIISVYVIIINFWQKDIDSIHFSFDMNANDSLNDAEHYINTSMSEYIPISNSEHIFWGSSWCYNLSNVNACAMFFWPLLLPINYLIYTTSKKHLIEKSTNFSVSYKRRLRVFYYDQSNYWKLSAIFAAKNTKLIWSKISGSRDLLICARLLLCGRGYWTYE
jgi:hypothetical protein